MMNNSADYIIFHGHADPNTSLPDAWRVTCAGESPRSHKSCNRDRNHNIFICPFIASKRAETHEKYATALPSKLSSKESSNEALISCGSLLGADVAFNDDSARSLLVDTGAAAAAAFDDGSAAASVGEAFPPPC